MNFQSSKLLLLHDFNRFIASLYGQSFVFFWSKLVRIKPERSFWSKIQWFPNMGGVSFFRDLVNFYHFFVFQSFVQCNFSRQHVALSGASVSLEWFSQTRCLAMLILMENVPRQSVNIKGELVPLELFWHTNSFIHITSF